MNNKIKKLSSIFLFSSALFGLVFGLVACSSSRNVQLIMGKNSTYTVDTESRLELKQTEYIIDPTVDQTNPFIFNYTVQTVTNKVNSIFSAANLSLQNLSSSDYTFITNLINAIIENNQTKNLIAWEDPSILKQGNQEKALIYLEGGPAGDASSDNVKAIQSLPSTREYYLQESQYGFVPKTIVKNAGTNLLENKYFVGLNGQLQNVTRLKNGFLSSNNFDNHDYIRIISGNADISDDNITLLSSIAHSIVTADRSALLAFDLSKKYGANNVFLMGESYGFVAGLESILQNPNILNYLGGVEIGRNTLSPGESHQPAPPSDKDGDGDDDSGVTYGDSGLINDVTNFWDKYGFIERVRNFLNSNSPLVPLFKSKMVFGFSSNDQVIGPLSSEEKSFYASNGLNLIQNTGTHSSFFREAWPYSYMHLIGDRIYTSRYIY